MNFPVHLLLIVTQCFYLATADPYIEEGESKIVGGHDAIPHSHPYIVSLQTRLLYIRMHICGGALLNKRFVLSAAHCATESWLIRWLPMDAVAGIHDVNKLKTKQTQVIQIMSRIPHPLYEGGIGPHDIALFKTMAPFTYTKVVQPIKLATKYNYKSVGDSLKVAGWGALKTTTFIPDLPSRLQEVKVTYIPFQDCYNALENLKEPGEINPLDEDSNICTGPTTGGVAACVGDSGGPLVQIINEIIPAPHDPVEDNTEKYNASLYDCPNGNENNDNRNNDNVNKDDKNNDNGNNNGTANTKRSKQVEPAQAVLLGIVSWGVSPCGERGAPSVYTNVTTYIDFIKYTLKND